MIFIKLAIIALSAQLWRMGGTEGKAWCRDVLIPILLGAFIGYRFGFIAGFASIGSYQIIRIGYGAYDPEHDSKPSFLGGLLKDRKGALTRGLAGFLYTAVGASILLFHHINIYAYLGVSLATATVSFLLCFAKSKDVVIERVIGAMVASIVLFI